MTSTLPRSSPLGSAADPSSLKVFVTGGGGFLGTAICRQLRAARIQVRSFSRHDYPLLRSLGCELVQGDLRDLAQVTAAMQGCTAVIHSAALAGIWGRAEDFYAVNVQGTQNCLAAAQARGIKVFVHTSSPSVVFGQSDLCGADESQPYPAHYLSYYPWSKKLAEEAVLAAHRTGGVRCIALRPHLIWGPQDPHFIPRLVAKARQGRLWQVGKRDNKVDIIYVDNAAKAHVLALQALLDKPQLAGKAYFLGQHEPVNLWDFIDQLLAVFGLQPVQRALPFGLAYAFGSLCERLFKTLRLYHREPLMTRFLALQLAKSHYFDHQQALRDFNYQPEISTAEGLRRLRDTAL